MGKRLYLSEILPEMLKIATNREFEKNRKESITEMQRTDGIDMRLDLQCPYIIWRGELIRYNIYQAKILVRHASDGRKYLYDILEIKKK